MYLAGDKHRKKSFLVSEITEYKLSFSVKNSAFT